MHREAVPSEVGPVRETRPAPRKVDPVTSPPDDDIENDAVVCPLHGWVFDLKSGAMQGNPKILVKTYDVETKGDEIFVRKKNA